MNCRPFVGFCLLAAALVSGCTSVRYSQQGGREMVTVSNCGWKLLGFFTLASGDPDYPNQEVCSWFTNTVTVATNMRLLDEEATRRHASGCRDICSFTTDKSMLLFLLKRFTLNTSAELVR